MISEFRKETIRDAMRHFEYCDLLRAQGLDDQPPSEDEKRIRTKFEADYQQVQREEKAYEPQHRLSR